jgi:hypothetical protein
MKIINAFLGEIELTKLGETSRNLMGESVVDTIYVDERGDYYIDTWTTTGGDPIPMKFLRKELIDKINELSKQ